MELLTRSRCVIYLLLAIALLPFTPRTVFAQAQQPRVLYGMVYSLSTGGPIPAIVSVTSCDYTESIVAGADGSWKLAYQYGRHARISFSAPGYETQSFDLTTIPQWFYAGGTLSLQPSR